MIRIKYDYNEDVSALEFLPSDKYLFWSQTYEKDQGKPKIATALFATLVDDMSEVIRDLSESNEFRRVNLRSLEFISMDSLAEKNPKILKRRRGRIRF